MRKQQSHRKSLRSTYRETLRSSYLDIYIYLYLNIYIPPYVHIYVAICLDIIHTSLRTTETGRQWWEFSLYGGGGAIDRLSTVGVPSHFPWPLRVRKLQFPQRKSELLFSRKKEQAEVGQSPTLLAVCAANGVLGILRGYPYGLTAPGKSFLVYPAVYRKDFYRYINKSWYQYTYRWIYHDITKPVL